MPPSIDVQAPIFMLHSSFFRLLLSLAYRVDKPWVQLFYPAVSRLRFHSSDIP